MGNSGLDELRAKLSKGVPQVNDNRSNSPQALSGWGDSVMCGLKGKTRTRRKADASKRRRVAEKQSMREVVI